MSITEFEQAMDKYFRGTRPPIDVASFRAKRGAQKKLRDEVSPVLNHVRFVNAEGEIRFELNDSIPDCWLRSGADAEPHGLEVTVAKSREQYHLGVELNEKPMGRGFLGLADDAPSKAFSERLAKSRVMYTTETALRAIGNGIKNCLQKKADPKYVGFDLLIEAPLPPYQTNAGTKLQQICVRRHIGCRFAKFMTSETNTPPRLVFASSSGQTGDPLKESKGVSDAARPAQ